MNDLEADDAAGQHRRQVIDLNHVLTQWARNRTESVQGWPDSGHAPGQTGSVIDSSFLSPLCTDEDGVVVGYGHDADAVECVGHAEGKVA